MRILLDECLTKDLKYDLVGHEASTVREMGWSGTKNGKLLSLAEEHHFDVFLTSDRNIEYQQNLKNRQLGVAIFISPDNRAEMLRPLIPTLLEAVDSSRPGDVLRIAVGSE